MIKKFYYIPCLTILCINPVKSQENCIHNANHFKCMELSKVKSADKVTFNVPNLHPLIGQEVNIITLNTKSPSIYSRNKCAKEVAKLGKKFTKEQLKSAKKIEAINLVKDKNFNFKGDIIYDKKNLSEELLKNKLAAKEEDFKAIDWCKKKKEIENNMGK
jgi:micrococcal nuclease